MTAAGHLSTAFLIKSRFKNVPFWVLLFSAEAIELVWVFLNLNLIGLKEPLEITKINFPFMFIGDMILFHQIVSHSFFGALSIGLILALIFKGLKQTKGIFLAVFLGVFGHWCLDFIVHDADLPIFISLESAKLGPLLNFDSTHPEQGFFTTAPLLGFCFQSFFSILSALLFLRSFPIVNKSKRNRFWLLVAIVNLSILGIFVKGGMTWLIKTPLVMVIMVFLDIMANGLILYFASRLANSDSIQQT